MCSETAAIAKLATAHEPLIFEQRTRVTNAGTDLGCTNDGGLDRSRDDGELAIRELAAATVGPAQSQGAAVASSHDHNAVSFAPVRAVAIVNGNARRLGGRMRTKLERALPGGVRFTGSLDEARSTIRAEVRRGVDLIVLGGGDGTVVMGLTLIGEACRAGGRREPAIGILRMGSGNAIADTVGAGDDVIEDLSRIVRGGGERRQVPLLEVLGVRAPFVGMGVDALLLEDHAAIDRVVDRVPIARSLMGGTTRYALAVALRSVPRFATGARPNAVVTNLGTPAIEMRRTGPTGREEAAGQVLWKGACTLVAGATIPFFGFGLKMFAFATARHDKFHLRCGDAGLFEIMRNTPAAFRGEYFSDHVADYLCDKVSVALDQDTAIEAGGELLGRRNHVELAMSPPITVIALENSPR